jgi:hypothetical protein
VASRNGFYQGRTIWNQTQGSGVPAGAPVATGVAPVATPGNDGRSATLSWSGVFTDNGKAITDYFAGVFQGGAAPGCSVSGVGSGAPVLHADPESSRFKRVQGGSVGFDGLEPNQTYDFVVYAYNGQGCTASQTVSATVRQAPGSSTGVDVTAGLQGTGAGTYDVPIEVRYDHGSGTTSAISYTLISADGEDPGTLSGASGVATGSIGNHYGDELSIRIDRICETYPDGSQLCSAPGATYPLGTTAVDTNLTLPRYEPLSRTFTWVGWPTGSGYSSVTYTCDGGATRSPMPAAGQTASCAATGAGPDVLEVEVTAGGTAYRQEYAASGLP